MIIFLCMVIVLLQRRGIILVWIKQEKGLFLKLSYISEPPTPALGL